MTVDHALTILTANAEWAAGVDVVRHYEDAAEAFYRDTGIMAPGKSRPLGWPDAGDDDRLAWATWCKARAVERLEAVRLLRTELAEALATLANERGEGEPPDPSFKWRAGRWVSDTIGAQIVRGERGWHVEDLWYDAHVQHSEPAHPSARVAMIAASAAKGGAR